MAQINLLKQKDTSQTFLEMLPSLLVKILAVGVLALLLYYVWLFVAINKTNSDITGEQEAIASAQQQANSVGNREEIYTRQEQLKQLSSLISSHPYWSNIFPSLASVTLKSASYSSLTITKDGQLTVSLTVPDLQNLDKYLQVFDLPEFNQNFNSLRMGAFQKVQQNGETGYSVDVRMNFNPSLLQYSAALDGNN